MGKKWPLSGFLPFMGPALVASVAYIDPATDGKAGMEAFWSGSATPNVTSRTSIPHLLVPVNEKREKE